MSEWFSDFLDTLSEFLAHRKGLLPLVGIVLVIANLLLQIIMGSSFLAESDLLLHLGLIVAIVGLMLARVL